MSQKSLLIVWIAAVTLVLLGCGSLQVGVVTPTAQANPENVIQGSPSQPEVISPSETIAAPTEEPAPDFSYLWTEYRDTHLDYGAAIPAHWIISPPPAEGEGGAMVTTNYDEAYFLAHSIKGWWTGGEPPEGVIKIDFVSLNDEYPDLDLATAISDILGQDELTVVLDTQPALFNGHEAVLVTVARPDQPEETQTSVAFRLPNGYLLLIAPYWKSALESSDVQIILNSIALPGEPVRLPKTAPNPPLSSTPDTETSDSTDPNMSTDSNKCDPGYLGTQAEVIESIQYDLEIGNFFPFSYMIGDPFVIGYWRSEGISLSREEAFAELQENYFPTPEKVTFTLEPAQFPSLDGTPLENLWGPQADVVANIYTTGWGPDGLGEAILAIARCSENGYDSYFWYGMLYAMNGFE